MGKRETIEATIDRLLAAAWDLSQPVEGETERETGARMQYVEWFADHLELALAWLDEVVAADREYQRG